MGRLLLLIALGLTAPAAASAAGWPVAPVDQQHPIRSAFLDPRPGAHGLVFHTGIDISVRDDFPAPGHPAQRTHRVYALEGGVVEFTANTFVRRCSGRLVRIGRFTYAHVDPVGVVWPGKRVQPGDHVGWTCKGQWHLHLSERAWIDGRLVLVNPLRLGGALRPYVDAVPPAIYEFEFARPAPLAWRVSNGVYHSEPAGTELDPAALSGRVEPRVRIGDREDFGAWPPRLAALAADRAPAEVRVTLRRVRDGALLWSHVAFSATHLLADGRPAVGGFAAGTTQTAPAEKCLTTWLEGGCSGQLWFALAPLGASDWDTTTYENGAYELCVAAYDAVRNDARACRAVTVAN